MPPLSTLSKTCVALAVGQLLALPSLSHAATITVDSNTDDGVGCTLREAIVSANTTVDKNNDCALGSSSGTDTITFVNSLVSNTILLNSKIFVGRYRNNDIEINASTIDGGITVDANQGSRVFSISNSQVTLDGLTITQGGESSGYDGGGIAIYGAAVPSVVTLNNCLITNNSAESSNSADGGGISVSDSTLSLTNSTVSGNTAARRGGGIYARNSTINLYDSSIDNNRTTGGENSGARGGGIHVTSDGETLSTVTLTGSLISNNTSFGNGSGIYASDISSLTLSNSSVSDNTSSGSRGKGGGVFLRDANATINSTTISGNSSTYGGGLAARYGQTNVTINNSTINANSVSNGAQGGGINATGQDVVVTINNSTVSGNSSSFRSGGIRLYNADMTLNNVTVSDNFGVGSFGGAGIYASGANDRLTINNSIVANSIGAADCFFASSQNLLIDSASIIEDGSCGASRFGDPGLLALADNGAPTQTHALGENSIARNSSTGTCLVTDQRGETRDISDGFCDVGAVEFFEELPSLAVSASLASIIEGNEGTSTFSFTVSRSVNTLSASSVEYTVAGVGSSAANAADFGGLFPSGLVSFADGESSRLTNVLITGDTDIEPDEMFTVSLSKALNANIGTASTVATIVNDDVDTDEDGTVDSIDTNDDNDSVPDSDDNCQFVKNDDQLDTDSDLLGDACDDDDDGDNIADVDDVCPLIEDPDQADQDNDGVGDACEVDGEDDICFPIKTASENVATICL